jgi:hypothetical protein
MKKNGKIVNCANCGKDIYRAKNRIDGSKSQLFFCEKSCLDKYRTKRVKVTCNYCKKEKEVVFSRRARKHYCNKICLGKGLLGINLSGFFKKGNTKEKCINYKEGKQVCNGYITVLDHNHPNRSKKNYVYEHRVVMEKHIGRLLTEKEVVHHIDFNKKNNDISNLMLFENDSEHKKYHNVLRRQIL